MSEHIINPDSKALRTKRLVDQIMYIINPFITDYENNLHQKAWRALYVAFYENDINMVSKVERAYWEQLNKAVFEKMMSENHPIIIANKNDPLA